MYFGLLNKKRKEKNKGIDKERNKQLTRERTMDTKEVRKKEIREGRQKEGGRTSKYTKAYNILTWRIS